MGYRAHTHTQADGEQGAQTGDRGHTWDTGHTRTHRQTGSEAHRRGTWDTHGIQGARAHTCRRGARDEHGTQTGYRETHTRYRAHTHTGDRGHTWDTGHIRTHRQAGSTGHRQGTDKTHEIHKHTCNRGRAACAGSTHGGGRTHTGIQGSHTHGEEDTPGAQGTHTGYRCPSMRVHKMATGSTRGLQRTSRRHNSRGRMGAGGARGTGLMAAHTMWWERPQLAKQRVRGRWEDWGDGETTSTNYGRECEGGGKTGVTGKRPQLTESAGAVGRRG
jgi:hypothetical protein